MVVGQALSSLYNENNKDISSKGLKYHLYGNLDFYIDDIFIFKNPKLYSLGSIAFLNILIINYQGNLF